MQFWFQLHRNSYNVSTCCRENWLLLEKFLTSLKRNLMASEAFHLQRIEEEEGRGMKQTNLNMKNPQRKFLQTFSAYNLALLLFTRKVPDSPWSVFTFFFRVKCWRNLQNIRKSQQNTRTQTQFRQRFVLFWYIKCLTANRTKCKFHVRRSSYNSWTSEIGTQRNSRCCYSFGTSSSLSPRQRYFSLLVTGANSNRRHWIQSWPLRVLLEGIGQKASTITYDIFEILFSLLHDVAHHSDTNLMTTTILQQSLDRFSFQVKVICVICPFDFKWWN